MSGFQHELFHSADPSYNAALLVVQTEPFSQVTAGYLD